MLVKMVCYQLFMFSYTEYYIVVALRKTLSGVLNYCQIHYYFRCFFPSVPLIVCVRYFILVHKALAVTVCD